MKIITQGQKINRLLNRLWIVRNKKKIGKLGSRDLVIRNYCQPSQIVIDIFSLSNLIGKQVFNLLNRLYSQTQNIWAVFGNSYIIYEKNKKNTNKLDFLQSNQISPGINIVSNKHIMLNKSQYRESDLEVTGYFKSYLRQVYMRIPMTHLLERMSLKYYQYAADQFVTYSIVQLCGEPHTLFISQQILIHFEEETRRIFQEKPCGQALFNFEKYLSKVMKPNEMLQSLTSPLKATSANIIEKNRRNFIQSQKQYNFCVAKQQNLEYLFNQS